MFGRLSSSRKMEGVCQAMACHVRSHASVPQGKKGEATPGEGMPPKTDVEVPRGRHMHIYGLYTGIGAAEGFSVWQGLLSPLLGTERLSSLLP